MEKASVYLFYGTETFLIEERIQQIKNNLIPKEDHDFNTMIYDLLENPLEDVIQEAETLPFLSKHKIVIAKNAILFTGQKSPKAIEYKTEILEQYLENPADYTTIIFWTEQEKLDERKKIVKKMKQNAKIEAFTQLEGTSLIHWVKKTAFNHDAQMTDQAVELLIQMVGQNLRLLSREIEKMALYVGKQQIINDKIVEELGIRTIEQDIFSLVEKAANLQIEEALKIFYDLLKNKEEPIKILVLFARQFRLILFSKQLFEKGYSAKQIAGQLGVHPYSVQIAIKQAARFNEKQLENIIKKLAETDTDIKSGRKEKVLALEMFMFYISKIVQNRV